jgi:sulfatase maturation enzyme AslB (radical SAM superfamily)
MSLDTAKKFIDLLIDNDENTRQYMDTSKSDAVILDFIGGEPFLQVELID